MARRDFRQTLARSSIGEGLEIMQPYLCTSHLVGHIPTQETGKCFGCEAPLVYDRSAGRWADVRYFESMTPEELNIRQITRTPDDDEEPTETDAGTIAI